MTREEAIDVLDRNYPDKCFGILCDAVDMAIETLEEQKTGECIDWLGTGNEWECSECKCSIESHGSIAYRFCPNCGAKMEMK